VSEASADRPEWTEISRLLTSEGKTKRDGDQSGRGGSALWSIAGQSSGSACSITPTISVPQPSRLAPETAYFCFAPASLGALRSSQASPSLVLRFVVHDGKLDGGRRPLLGRLRAAAGAQRRARRATGRSHGARLSETGSEFEQTSPTWSGLSETGCESRRDSPT